jgi:hypothetical protein
MNAREARRRGRDTLCWECPHPLKPPDAVAMAKMRRWWLEESSYSLEELEELGTHDLAESRDIRTYC